MAKTKVIQVHRDLPDLDVLAEAASVLRTGRVIAFPTETVYGIGALKRFPQAIERIYEIKRRPKDRPLSHHLANYVFTLQLKLDRDVDRALSYLTKKFWPGPLTMIVRDQEEKTYGLRMPKHTVARILIELCGEPVVATSANLSGESSAVSPEEVLQEMDGKIDLLIDSGRCELAEDSTVCDLTESPFRITRRGTIFGEVENILNEIQQGVPIRKKILLVCTGNTCRSPMAEGWLKQEIARKGLGDRYEAESSGAFALRGVPPTEEAIQVLAEEGIDIGDHQAQPLTHEVVRDADLILTMAVEHERFILNAFPYLSGKVRVLDIADPIGMPLTVYRDCFGKMREKLRTELEWLRD